jgi:hypothetical protein
MGYMFKYLAIVLIFGFTMCGLNCLAADKVVTAPPASWRLNPFYQKYCDANGLAILGSSKVSDDAIIVARDIVTKMLWGREDIVKRLQSNHVLIAVMAPTEVTTDIPEHSDLNRVFPGTNWNVRCRGVGATKQRPVCSCAEENLLQYANDRYRGENILVHEFGHTILLLGVVDMYPSFLD